MVQPIDQGAILASGRALVPDYAAQLVQERLLGIREQESVTNQQRVSAAVTQQARENAEEDRLQQALSALGENPTASQMAELMMRFPRFSEHLRRGWQTLDETNRRSDFQTLAEVHDAARGGNYELAARSLQQRIEADRAAGQPEDPMSAAILAGLQSGDPTEQQRAVDVLERSLAALAGPEHYASVYGTFSRRTAVIDDILVDLDTGEAITQSPYPRVIPGANGSFFEQPRVSTIPVLGGTAASGGSAGGAPAPEAAPPAQGAGAGGLSPRSAAAANNPGGLRVSDWTRAQPGFVGETRNGFARFDTPQNGIAAQERLLRSTYLRQPRSIRQVVERYAPRRGRGGDNTDEQVDNYVAYVARRLGVSADQPIDATMTSALAQAMREFETGRRGRGRIASNDTPHVNSRQQYNRLPSGARYIAPDGTIRTKP